MTDTALLYLICGLLLLALAVLVALLLRRPDAALERLRGQLEEALRAEQRDGRLELRQQLDGLATSQGQRIDGFARHLGDLGTRTDARLDTLRDTLTEDARKHRQESADSQQRSRESLATQLRELTVRNEQRIGEMRATLEQQLRNLQADNALKLEKMRETVDEKLHSTLTTRLDSSFKLVSERLEQVQRGLGEMQQLATGVDDLKRVLGNVKTRGGWGEVQLEAILEQVLTSSQYARGVKLRPDGDEMVDFAIRLPGRGQDQVPVWLPIDAKFPREDYERLLDAQEQGDPELVRSTGAQLEKAIRTQARSISDKYVVPPHSTDFAVMFLPTEGLYAEVIRRPGLTDALQREHRVVVAGPTTVTALLNSLQMGFRTLAIEQRSGEVWALLGAVKSEFGKFAGILEKAEKQINTVGKSLGDASRKTRTIERRLRSVESLDQERAQALLGEVGPEEVGFDEAESDEAGDEDPA